MADRYVNTGAAVRLMKLLTWGDIDDDTVISVFSHEGHFITRGHWYSDRVLEYSSETGRATREGANNAISFRLKEASA